MRSILSYILAGGAGFFVAHALSRAPELRAMRLSQLILVPVAFIAAAAVMPQPSQGEAAAMTGLVLFILILAFITVLLAPNIAFMLGSAFSNFIDPLDWTSAEEEIALRPILKLIDSGRYQDAFDELEGLVKTRRPTFEAFHIRAKLLHHFQRFDETVATLLQMIRLSKSAQQQLIALELLDSLENHQKSPAKTFVQGPRPMRIAHELILFDTNSRDRSMRKEIPAGEYQVEEILVGRNGWLVLKGESWGNAENCWEAVKETAPAPGPKKGFLHQIARMHHTVALAIKGKTWRQARSDAKALHQEANEFIRRGEWAKALPLLERASADDPDCYEIAYRLLQATHQSSSPFHARSVLDKILRQSRWTDDEMRMLKELRR